MVIEIIKGSDLSIAAVVYNEWTGNIATSLPANLTGATVRAIFKDSLNDTDAQELFNVTCTIVDALNGIISIPITAAQTNNQSLNKIYFQVAAKLASGIFRKSEVQSLVLKQNIYLTLF